MPPEVCWLSPRTHCRALGRCEAYLRIPHQQVRKGLCFRELIKKKVVIYATLGSLWRTLVGIEENSVVPEAPHVERWSWNQKS